MTKCNQHPDAPHGFMRDASRNADRYVCECEGWEPPVGYVYSLTSEEFHDLETIMYELLEEREVGEIVSVERGVSEVCSHRDLLHPYRVVELLQEQAYEEYGEYSEDYLNDITRDKADELDNLIAEWLNKNCEPPTFWKVTDVKEVKIVVADV